MFAPSSGKEKDTAKLLADYLTVSTTAPTELGIEPEVLEMAWELCSETEAKDFSPKVVHGRRVGSYVPRMSSWTGGVWVVPRMSWHAWRGQVVPR